MMVSEVNHPQMALIQFGNLLYVPQICLLEGNGKDGWETIAVEIDFMGYNGKPLVNKQFCC